MSQAFTRIAPPRRNLFYSGMAMIAAGFAISVLGFTLAALGVSVSDEVAERIQETALWTTSGLVLVMAGALFMRLGYAGWVEKSHDAISRMGDRLHGAATALVNHHDASVHCRGCHASNDDQAKYCDQCGTAI